MPHLLLALMLAAFLVACDSDRRTSGNVATCPDGRMATLGEDAYRDSQGRIRCNPQ